MNPKFKNGIIVLGLVVPLLLIAIGMAVLFWQFSRVGKEYKLREQNLALHLKEQKQLSSIRSSLGQYATKKAHWENVIATSDIPAVNLMLEELTKQYPDGFLTKRDFKYVNRQTGVAQISSQPSVSFDLTLDGTYGAIQECLLTMESQLPHLTLNQMKIGPGKDLTTLNVDLSYSVWAK